MAYEKLTDYKITNTATSFLGGGCFAVDKAYRKSLFLINQDSSNSVTFTIYGSPDGIQASSYTTPATPIAPMTQAIINLHYVVLTTQVVGANSCYLLDLSNYTVNFIRIDAIATSGSPIVNFSLMQAGAWAD